MTQKPTVVELREAWLDEGNEYFHIVSEHTQLYGNKVLETIVFERVSDKTFWEVSYSRSTDGYHALRDNDVLEVNQVYPRNVTITVFDRVVALPMYERGCNPI